MHDIIGIHKPKPLSTYCSLLSKSLVGPSLMPSASHGAKDPGA